MATLDPGKFIKGAIGVVILAALIKPVFTNLASAEAVENLSASEQAMVSLIGLVFVAAAVYSVYQAMVE